MKVFIPFQVRSASDADTKSTRFWGPSTFVQKFVQGLKEKDHSVTFEPTEDYDALFVVVQCPLRFLRHAKQRNKPIIQRLDGVYYWSVASWKFPLLNAKATYARHFFTDLTVYQSKYSKYCVEKFLGRKRSDQSAVIYNGVDLSLFSPKGPKHQLRDYPKQKVFFTASAFRRRDQIVPILDAVEIYRKKYGRDCKLVIAGNFIGEVAELPDTYKRKYIQYLGKINNHDLSKYDRGADVFVFTHLNPPCPNNVIEAMACGLPICGVADGSMRELVDHEHNGLLVPTAGDAFWYRRSINTEAFADHLQQIIAHQGTFSRAARKKAEEHFSLEAMVTKYIAAMERATQG